MTKPCRAASSSMFSLNINFWCFSFVTLFNLQGTRPSASAAERALSYHVVRLLSSTFFNFFEVFSALNAAFRRSLRQLIYFTRAYQVCQALFSLLSKFFRSRRWHDRRVSDSLLTIPALSHFVNTFFPNFSIICKTTFPFLNTGYSFPSSPLPIPIRRTQIAWFSALFSVHIVDLSYILLVAHRVSYC